MTNIFTASRDTAQQMADSLPQGRAWGAKNQEGSNTRGLIEAVSVAHNRTQQQIELMDREFRIELTTDLLEEWEKSVGIPDECVIASDNLISRRRAVVDRLQRCPFVTLQDIQDYVDSVFPGMNVKLYIGSEYYTFEYAFELPFLGAVDERFIIVAEVPLSSDTFEYEWEIHFEGGVDTTQLECVLNKILPANVLLIIENRE